MARLDFQPIVYHFVPRICVKMELSKLLLNCVFFIKVFTHSIRTQTELFCINNLAQTTIRKWQCHRLARCTFVTRSMYTFYYKQTLFQFLVSKGHDLGIQWTIHVVNVVFTKHGVYNNWCSSLFYSINNTAVADQSGVGWCCITLDHHTVSGLATTTVFDARF